MICEKICDTPVIKLSVNHAYDIVEMVGEMNEYRNDAIAKLVAFYHEIVRYLVFVFEGVESSIQTVCKTYPSLYIDKNDGEIS